jgi:hypothetical protein
MLQVIDQMIQAAFGGFAERAFGAEISSLVIMSISVGILVIITAGTWRTYEKAGEPGWACLVPIYNLIVWLRIAGERWWCVLLLMIPGINIVVHLLVSRDVAKRFGKGTFFGLGLCFAGFVFYPILGFGHAQYQNET